MILLFYPNRPNLRHREYIILEYLTYSHLLQRYLIINKYRKVIDKIFFRYLEYKYSSICEAKEIYLNLLSRLEGKKYCNYFYEQLAPIAKFVIILWKRYERTVKNIMTWKGPFLYYWITLTDIKRNFYNNQENINRANWHIMIVLWSTTGFTAWHFLNLYWFDWLISGFNCKNTFAMRKLLLFFFCYHDCKLLFNLD